MTIIYNTDWIIDQICDYNLWHIYKKIKYMCVNSDNYVKDVILKYLQTFFNKNIYEFSSFLCHSLQNYLQNLRYYINTSYSKDIKKLKSIAFIERIDSKKIINKFFNDILDSNTNIFMCKGYSSLFDINYSFTPKFSSYKSYSNNNLILLFKWFDGILRYKITYKLSTNCKLNASSCLHYFPNQVLLLDLNIPQEYIYENYGKSMLFLHKCIRFNSLLRINLMYKDFSEIYDVMNLKDLIDSIERFLKNNIKNNCLFYCVNHNGFNMRLIEYRGRNIG